MPGTMPETCTCRLCGRGFAPAPPATPAQEAGAHLAAERYGDTGALCPVCLAARGILAMMYGPEGRD